MEKSILVIEDNQDVRENIVEILELDGYTVYSGANGKLGVQEAIDKEPSLIICDIMMPELDGYGVLKILSRNPKTEMIPFIFLTAKAEKADFRQGMRLGADDYLTKPFDDTELLEAVEMRLKKGEFIPSEIATNNNRTFSNQELAAKAIDQLCEGKEVRKFGAKQQIFQSGEISRYVYRVKKGLIKCYQTNDHGKELITHIAKEDHFFGHSSAVVEHQYNETAAAMEDSEIILIPSAEFRQLIFTNNDFAMEFIKSVVSESMFQEKKMISIAYSSVRKKVANALLALATYNETKTNYQISISRDDLAKYTGIAKETLIRTLSDFNSEGMIVIHSKHLEIIQKDELKNMPM